MFTRLFEGSDQLILSALPPNSAFAETFAGDDYAARQFRAKGMLRVFSLDVVFGFEPGDDAVVVLASRVSVFPVNKLFAIGRA